jgi:hypothetical protein
MLLLKLQRDSVIASKLRNKTETAVKSENSFKMSEIRADANGYRSVARQSLFLQENELCLCVYYK